MFLLQVCALYIELFALFGVAAGVIFSLMGPIGMRALAPAGADEVSG